jgi:hypothetical protein
MEAVPFTSSYTPVFLGTCSSTVPAIIVTGGGSVFQYNLTVRRSYTPTFVPSYMLVNISVRGDIDNTLSQMTMYLTVAVTEIT